MDNSRSNHSVNSTKSNNNSKSGKIVWIAVITFVCFAAIVFMMQKNSANASLNKDTSQKFAQNASQSADLSNAPHEKQVPVKLTAVSTRKFLKTITAYGKVEARQSAFVSPKIQGLIEKLFVDEGDIVEKDKTVLFEIDNLKLKQKISNAKQNLAIVLAVEKERKALLKKAEIDLSRTSRSCARYKALFEKKALTQEAYDAHEAEFLTASAELDHKKALMELGQAEAQQAIINLQMTEKDLADSIAIAPIDGIISEKLLETGEMGQPGKAIFKIVNTSDLEISAYIPAEYSTHIVKDQSEVELSIYEKTIYQKLKVTYKSPVVDSKLHIFEIKCRVEKNIPELQPGQSVQIKLVLEEHSATAVPSSALIEIDNGWAVYACESGVAKKLMVKRGTESEGWTEILESGLQTGSKVISEGQFLIKDNTSVTVIE